MQEGISISNHNDLVGFKTNKDQILLNVEKIYSDSNTDGLLPYYLKDEIDLALSNIEDRFNNLIDLLNSLDERVQALEDVEEDNG